MKKIVSGLLIAVILCACLSLAGCSVDPYYLSCWYLVGYTDENGDGHQIGCDTIAQTRLYSDDITIRYFEDKTFLFTEFGTEYTGTYTYKKRKGETHVSLTFSDGAKGKGTCAKYMFDGVWYVGTLDAFGKSYSFSEEWEEYYLDGERDFTPYESMGQVILEMLGHGWTERRVNADGYAFNFYKGKVVRRGEEFWFIPQNPQKMTEQNLSQATKLYTYETDGDFNVARGDNLLREGECFLNYASYREMVDSGSVDRYQYAVWYYGNVMHTLYPWTAEITPEEILSVKAEWSDHREESYYLTATWGQGSAEVKDFYHRLLQQLALRSEELDGAEKDLNYQILYTITTEENVFEVCVETGWYGEHYYAFVVDGKYYEGTFNNWWNIYPESISEKYSYAFEKPQNGAILSIDGNPVKTYEDLFEKIEFKFYYDYEYVLSSPYELTAGENRLVILDEKHFIWYGNTYYNTYCEVVGDTDFSAIFQEFPPAVE